MVCINTSVHGIVVVDHMVVGDQLFYRFRFKWIHDHMHDGGLSFFLQRRQSILSTQREDFFTEQACSPLHAGRNGGTHVPVSTLQTGPIYRIANSYKCLSDQ